MNNSENLELVQQISAEFQNRWSSLSSKQLSEPMLLLIGGYQGSGKTATFEKLAPKLDLTLVSTDQIRFTLFDRKIPYSDEFAKIVNAIAENLLSKAIRERRSIGIDSNARPEKIDRFKTIMEQSGGTNYRLYTVCLDAPTEELERRLLTRALTPGIYQGNIAELRSAIRQYGNLDRSKYDLCIDTLEHTPEVSAQIIVSHIRQQSKVD